MKQFYCPYCGEKSIPINFKFFHRIDSLSGHRNSKCPECKNILRKTIGTKGRKYIAILERLLILQLLLFFVSAFIANGFLLFFQLSMFILTTVLINYIHYIYLEFTTVQTSYYGHSANIELLKKGLFVSCHLVSSKIYQMKILSKDGLDEQHSVDYIVAIKKVKRIKKKNYSCKICFIQPKQPLFENENTLETEFWLLDDEKPVCKGAFAAKEVVAAM